MMEAVSELKGTRLALASESDGSKSFNETVLSRLTGGETLWGTKLQQTAFEFKPEFKIWMLANHLPFAKRPPRLLASDQDCALCASVHDRGD